jgi:hypothetical protein
VACAQRLREQLEEENAKKFGVPKQVAVEKSTAHLGNLGQPAPAPARPWQQQQQQQQYSQPPVVVGSTSQQVNINSGSAARTQGMCATLVAAYVFSHNALSWCADCLV